MHIGHALAVGLWSCLLGVPHGFVIEPSTSKEDIQRAFHVGTISEHLTCDDSFSTVWPCTLDRFSVLVVNTTLDATSLFADVDTLESMHVSTSSYHIELDIHLDGAATTQFSMHNASIVSSAVYIYSQNISIDTSSCINTTAQGLKFGPGFNSAVTVGSAYGGTGGGALSSTDMLLPSKCADVDVESTMYMQPIGDLKGSIGDFRGYGSGGGTDLTRGAGFVQLNASHTLQLDGLVLANGGFDSVSPPSRSGSGSNNYPSPLSIHIVTHSKHDGVPTGGTIRLSAAVLVGSGHVEACGGNATAPDPDSSDGGGGGGGGGGRVVLEYEKGHRGAVRVHVHGGTHAAEDMPPLWCQEGGAGTFLEVVRSTDGSLEGSIWILGRRRHAPPAGRMAGTPLFYRTSRRELMIEPWMLHVHVANHALVFASSVQLSPANNTSIEVK
ncbi:hypothetical protein DYB30_001343 [Aphanomyces astaci]|uniref:Uncharacterized protein n=1 Tax=Aphanomyces astaci TaxID=112090 RepID=A0A397C9Q7_APHAT|nr:hypothetical protein DYB30_001343 [Aphanomyces astaci]